MKDFKLHRPHQSWEKVEFLEQLNKYQLLKTNIAACSYEQSNASYLLVTLHLSRPLR